MINKEFEEFLNREKERFCKFRCEYRDGNSKGIELEEYCEECDRYIRVDVDPCEHCQVDEFMYEIRDCNVKIAT